MTEQKRTLAETVEAYNEAVKHLACLRVRANNEATRLSRISRALDAAADEEKENPRPLDMEDQAVSLFAGKMIMDISKAESRVLSLAKALKNMGVPASLNRTP